MSTKCSSISLASDAKKEKEEEKEEEEYTYPNILDQVEQRNNVY